MFSRARLTTLVLSAGVVMLAAASAQAQTATVNFTVSATAVARCTITAADLAFGNYDPTSATPLDVDGQLTVRCTRGTNATVGLGNGMRSNRTMANLAGTETLPYLLFRDAGRLQTWLDADPNWVSYNAGSNAGVNIPVYGRVPAGANVPAGAFTDTVVATIHF